MRRSRRRFFRLRRRRSRGRRFFLLPQIFLIDAIHHEVAILFQDVVFLVKRLVRNVAANREHLLDGLLQEIRHIVRAQNLARKLTLDLKEQTAPVEDALCILEQMEHRRIAVGGNEAELLPCALNGSLNIENVLIKHKILDLHPLLDVCAHIVEEARADEFLRLQQNLPGVSFQGNLHMLDDGGKENLLLRLRKLDALREFAQDISFFRNNT